MTEVEILKYTLIGVLITTIGLVIAFLRLRQSVRAQRESAKAQVISNTLNLYDRFEHPDVVKMRQKLKAECLEEGSPSIEFETWSDEEQAAVRSFAFLYCLASVLLQKKLVDKDLFFSVMARPIDIAGTRVEPYLLQRLNERKDEYLFNNFKWLQKEVKSYLDFDLS